MAYDINLFNGTLLVSVDDQTINTTATDLRLVGRNYSGYGEIQNENFLHLLENFANTAPPPHPISGQLWFDAANKKIKVYDGSKFKVVSGAEISPTAPTSLANGDFWFNTLEQQLFTWNGTEFVLIGPAKTPIFGDTSAGPATIKDAVGSNHDILKLQAGAEVVAIITKDEFVINGLLNPIPGFSSLKKGINFINSDANGVTSSDHRFWGTAANAQRLGGFDASSYIRTSNTSFITQVSFKDSGLTVGDQNDFRLQVQNGNETIIENTLGNPIIFRLTTNPADVRDVYTVNRDGLTPGLDEFYNLGSAGAKWKDVRAKDMYATTFHGNLIGNISGPDAQTPINLATTVVNGNLTIIQNLITTGGVQLNPTTTGTINNIDIGNVTRRTSKFTTIDANDIVSFTKNAESTALGNGTLIVTGGASISGNVNAGGNGSFNGTGAVKVPVGTTAQRPAVGVPGMIRYNTTIQIFEGFDGQAWNPLGGTQDEDWGLVTGQLDALYDLGGLF